MSMWEIEALMENTIHLIDKSNAAPNQKRQLIWNTYHLQGYFDCSFTHFRVMDVLLKHNYVQQYAIDEFPPTKQHPEFFQELSNKQFEWIHKRPVQPWSKDNPALAYWDKKHNCIFVDFGTEYYTNYPDEITQELAPLAFGKWVIQEGSRQQDKSIVYDWTAFMIVYLLAYFPPTQTLAQLQEVYFKDIKQVFQQFDYSSYEALHRGLDLEIGDNAEWFTAIQLGLIAYIVP
ncbi:MAG: hypothetical protein AB8E82_16835 [Aureispira sp.]